MLSFLGLLANLIGCFIIDVVESTKPQAPAIKDWDKYNRETISMSAKDIKRGIRAGRW